MIEITDFSAPELDVFARMTEHQLLNRENPQDGIFIAESPKVIERALDAGCQPISILVERKHIDGEAKPILDRCEGILRANTAVSLYGVRVALKAFEYKSDPGVPAQSVFVVRYSFRYSLRYSKM